MTRAVLCAALLLTAFTSHARAVIFDEGAAGIDLPTEASDHTPFVLVPGLNTVSGTIGASLDMPDLSDFDSFSIFVPVGTVLTSVSLTAFDTSSGETFMTRIVWDLEQPPGALPELDKITAILPTSDLAVLTAVLPLRAGTYGIDATGQGVGGPTIFPAGFATARYSFSLQLEAVPLPAGLSLLLGALGALGLMGRRRMN